MLRFGAIIRTLMLVVCLAPFASVQQAAGALAPYFPRTLAPAGESPAAPTSEEDDERENDGKERHSTAPRHRAPTRELLIWLPPAVAPHRTHVTRPRTSPPVAVDPFRNGLGTPYRC